MARTSTQAKEDSDLVERLVQLSKKDRRLVRSSTYNPPAMPELEVQSWKMNEFKYSVVPSPFPTLARGLFTTRLKEEAQSDKGPVQHKILVRGYDKFFNVGEVPFTKWDAIEKHTAPPYIVTLKSNGCIIFMCALSPSKLLVTSKHSLGALKDDPEKTSHAQRGEWWLKKMLEKKGKKTEELARVLWDNNWTAVAELCDDSFEEHVLPYTPEKSGLHLHGINDSAGVFKTQPSDKVNEFAREWGFIETAYHVEHTVARLRAFTEQVETSKQWNGEPIEGFVVRCRVKDGVESTDRDRPPYPSGSSFFFKVKYDEPYMMYRDWREITKAILAGRDPGRGKIRRPESRVYAQWVREEIKRNRQAFKEYNQGKGIIATREKFLAWLKTEEGKSKLTGSLADESASSKLKANARKSFKKTIIVPVAIPGCGKTTVAVALKHLFGFGHVQSDDIHAKKPAPLFIKRVTEALQRHDIVIADKNNHLKQHRDQLREMVEGKNTRLLALNWALDMPPAMVHRICSDRVVVRGENHQTLRPDTAQSHEEAIWMFINKKEELEDSEVDEVVEMNLEEDIEQSLARAVDACVQILGLPRPSQEDIGRALSAVHAYKPESRKEASKGHKQKHARYYGILPELSLPETMEGLFAEAPDSRFGAAEKKAFDNAKNFWNLLHQNKRVTAVPHITLVHEKSLPGQQAFWDHCMSLIHSSDVPPTFELKLGHIVYDDRAMAIAVESLQPETDLESGPSAAAADFVRALPNDVKKRLHITVGTRTQSINPVEAGNLVEKWRQGQAKDVSVVPLSGVTVKGRMKGLN